jgi:hypothetical protein
MKSVQNWILYLHEFSQNFPHSLSIFLARIRVFWFIFKLENLLHGAHLSAMFSSCRGPPVGAFLPPGSRAVAHLSEASAPPAAAHRPTLEPELELHSCRREATECHCHFLCGKPPTAVSRATTPRRHQPCLSPSPLCASPPPPLPQVASPHRASMSRWARALRASLALPHHAPRSLLIEPTLHASASRTGSRHLHVLCA